MNDIEEYKGQETQEQSDNKDVINEDMSTYDITKNVAKGSFILGKRFMQTAKETMEKMAEKAQKIKEEKGK